MLHNSYSSQSMLQLQFLKEHLAVVESFHSMTTSTGHHVMSLVTSVVNKVILNHFANPQ